LRIEARGEPLSSRISYVLSFVDHESENLRVSALDGIPDPL
jgi:hypothetical protein